MNQRNDTPDGEHGERGREGNGGREYYSSENRGFDDANARGQGGRESTERERAAGQMQSPQGQYERDSYARRQHYEQDRERWHGGFERTPRHEQRGQGRSPSDQYRPVTEEWEAARGYSDRGEERGYGAAQERYQPERYGRDESRYGEGRYGSRYGQGGYGADWRRGGEGWYGGEGRYGGEARGPRGRGEWGEGRQSSEGRYGWEGASQPNYGPRNYWSDRPSWQDQYGFGRRVRGRDPYRYRVDPYARTSYREGSSSGHFPRDEYGHEHSSEQLFDREPFGRREDMHYYGTGSPGWGGPGFTGGAYAYGDSTRYPQRPLESEYSDEAAVGYEGSYGRGYERGYGYGRGASNRAAGSYGVRRYARGPKGYQRSDERLKEDISERLMEAYDIDSSEVTVEVQGAKVILEGTVPSRHMKHAIEDLVDACPGVQDIENKVRVASPNYQGSSTTGSATGTSSKTSH